MQLTERGVWLSLQADEALHVEADDVLLGCALGNLLYNAVRFSRRGGRVGLSCCGEPGGVVIEVEDACWGFPAAPGTAPPLLGAGTVPVSGLGEGLRLTQELVLAMGGLLEVRAHPEGGCVFSLSLAAARPRNASTSARPRLVRAVTSGGRSQRERIGRCRLPTGHTHTRAIP